MVQLQKIKVYRSISIFLFVLTPAAATLSCSFEAHERGELCVYTVREVEQVVAEMGAFTQQYPKIKLDCPWTSEEYDSVVCDLGSGKIGESYEDCRNASWRVLRESTSILLERLQGEGEATKADFLWGLGISHLLEYSLEHPLAAYKPKHIEVIEEAIKEDFEGEKGRWFIDPAYQDQKAQGVMPKWVGITAYMNVFCVNETKMTEIYPNWTLADLTWENLIKPNCNDAPSLDPEQGECLEGWSYKGVVSMPRPDKSGTGSIAIAALLHYFDEQNKQDSAVMDGWSYLQALDQNIGQYTWSGTDPCRLAADYRYGPNDIAVAITGAVGAIKTDQSVEEELLIVPMPVGTAGYNIEANAILRKDSIKPSAHTLMDWGLSNEAFDVYVSATPLVARPKHSTTRPAKFPEDPETTWADYDFSELASKRTTDQIMWTDTFCPDDAVDQCRNKEGEPATYPVNENHEG